MSHRLHSGSKSPTDHGRRSYGARRDRAITQRLTQERFADTIRRHQIDLKAANSMLSRNIAKHGFLVVSKILFFLP